MRQLPENFFWLERPQKHYADQVRHPGGGHGVRGDGAVRAAHRQLGLAVHALQLVHGPKLGYFLLGLGYCSAALALWMLYNLYMFLARIEKEEVFTPANVLALRRISWCCTWLQRSACRWVLCWGCRSSLPLALRRRLWR